MDLEALLSRLDDEREPWQHSLVFAASIVLLVVFVVLATMFGYDLFVDPDLRIGHIKFSMEPVSYIGLGMASAMAPPAFNVTLHATSTFKNAFCSSGGHTLQTAFSGLTVAVGQVAPFCVKPKESAMVTGTASSAWTALPDDFRERIDRGQREGGVELEVNLCFENEFKGLMWVRCRTLLDADMQSTPCRTFELTTY